MLEHLLSDSIRLVAKLAERGEYADALVVMAPWADAGLPDLQKTVVANNVASLYQSMQQPVEALAWFESFHATLQVAGRLADRGDYADAVTAMVPWASWNLAPFENTILAYNLAQMFLKLGQPDEALAWFDWGIDHDRALGRTFVASHKAAALFELGRRDEAIALWRDLLASGLPDDAARTAIESNLRLALDRG